VVPWTDGAHNASAKLIIVPNIEPPFDLSEKVIQQIREHTHDLSRHSGKIALALHTMGLVNIQFAISRNAAGDEVVYVIEANPRASRTVPFIAKAYGEPNELGHQGDARRQAQGFPVQAAAGWLCDRCPSSASISSPTWTRAWGLR